MRNQQQNVTGDACRPASIHGPCCRCHLLSFGFCGFLVPPVFSPLCLSNRPSINPITTGENHIRWIINQLSIEAAIITGTPNSPNNSTTPKEDQLLFRFIETINPGTKEISCVFGSRRRFECNLDNSPNKSGHRAMKK